MADSKSAEELRKQYNESKNILENLTSLDAKRLGNQQIMAERQKLINKLLTEGLTTQQKEDGLLEKLIADQEEQINNEKDLNTQLQNEIKSRERIVGLVKSLGSAIKEGWKYLQEQDKTIKNTILSLGMSGNKADLMRKSFEDSAKFVARLGGSLADVQAIQQGYADETGRARAMTASMVEDITLIGKGTGLGIEQATKLGAQFEFMGLDAKRSMNYVQGIVDTSERMGINTTKVLKNITDNFKKVNTYSFASGVKGIAKMAEDAEKFQVDMKDALSAADAAKGLEKAIDLAANLQIMGGEFAKTDPFEWMYLARNEPDKLTKKISEMTRGLVTFKKDSEGVFQKFISPADRQRLESVAKSLGISNEEMVKITERRADLDKMSQQMAGTGLTGREKELVQGAAIFNAKSGKFEVELAGSMKDISTLTETQAKSFEQEQVTLAERAKQAMTFDQTFKATIEILKASLLPLLTAVNKYLLPPVKALADLAAKGGWGLAGVAAGLLAAAGALKVGSIWLGRAVDKYIAGGVGKGGFRGAVGNTFGKTAVNEGETVTEDLGKKGLSGLARQREGIGQGAAMAGKGKMFAGAGAGIGMAAAGVGAGIGAAAAGISLLANAMSKLDTEKAKVLAGIVRTLGVVMTVGIGAAVGIAAIGAAGEAVAPGLLAFGGAIALIGLGIGVAAGGIGVMGMGLAKMIDSAKGAGTSLGTVALGIAEIGVAMAGTGVASIFGGGAMVIGLRQIANQAPAIAAVGKAFANIKAVLSGSKEDFVAVQNAISAIANTNVNAGGAFGQLAALLKTPLKVEFADKNVQLSSDVTLNIDGNKFMNKIFKTNTAITHQEELRTQSVNQ
jgi:hypothetical protein